MQLAKYSNSSNFIFHILIKKPVDLNGFVTRDMTMLIFFRVAAIKMKKVVLMKLRKMILKEMVKEIVKEMITEMAKK